MQSVRRAKRSAHKFLAETHDIFKELYVYIDRKQIWGNRTFGQYIETLKEVYYALRDISGITQELNTISVLVDASAALPQHASTVYRTQ